MKGNVSESGSLTKKVVEDQQSLSKWKGLPFIWESNYFEKLLPEV